MHHLFPTHVAYDQELWFKLDAQLDVGYQPLTSATVDDIARRLYTTELAMVGELLARGGADYRSEWSVGSGRKTQYARIPPLVMEYFTARAKRHAFNSLDPSNPLPTPLPPNNPLVGRLIAARPNTRCVIGFPDIDFAKQVYKRAIELHLDQIEKAADNPYALQAKHTGAP